MSLFFAVVGYIYNYTYIFFIVVQFYFHTCFNLSTNIYIYIIMLTELYLSNKSSQVNRITSIVAVALR